MAASIILTGTIPCRIHRRYRDSRGNWQFNTIGEDQVPAKVVLRPAPNGTWSYRFEDCSYRDESEPVGSAPIEVVSGKGLSPPEVALRGRDNAGEWWTQLEWVNSRSKSWHPYINRDRPRKEYLHLQAWDHAIDEVFVDAVFPKRPYPRADIELTHESTHIKLDRRGLDTWLTMLRSFEDAGAVEAWRREDEPVTPIGFPSRENPQTSARRPRERLVDLVMNEPILYGGVWTTVASASRHSQAAGDLRGWAIYLHGQRMDRDPDYRYAVEARRALLTGTGPDAEALRAEMADADAQLQADLAG